MASKITKELIIDTTLDLINDKEGIYHVNLREIARKLGCAHTNLYNYFNNFEEILWQALKCTFLRLLDYVTLDIENIYNTDLRLEYFFSRFIEFYIYNKGWFKLIWFDKISENRPEESTEIIHRAVDILTNILYESYSDVITKEQSHYILHTVHCYLHGEVSIYISGKGLIKEEIQFKNYVTKECIKITKLLILSIQNDK